MKKKYLEGTILLCGFVLLFLIGVYAGSVISYSGDLEGDLINATDSNATSSNATDSNATSSDATSSNATSSNISINDYVMYLYDFSLGATSAKAGDRLNINFATGGACINGATLQLIRNDGKYTLSMVVKDIGANPYVTLPDFINTGDYVVKSLLIVGNNSDGSTFNKNFASNPSFSGDTKFDFNSSIHLEASINKVDVDLIESIDLKKTSIVKGSKLYIDVKNHKDVRAVRLNFIKTDDKRYTFYSYINSINNKPYLLIPSSAASGEYILDNIYVETYNYGSVIYTNKQNNESKYLNYTYKYNLIDENNENSKVVYYNNEDIDTDLIKKIRESDTITDVHIMAEDNSIISEDVINIFRNNKGKNLVVHYKDVTYTFTSITDNKAFDASVQYETIDSKNELSEIIPDGIKMTFASNGNLPGEAKITLNNKEMINKAFKDSKVNVYYYHEDNNKFEIVKEDLALEDDKLEFNISHTSSYIITNSKVSSTHVYSEDDEKNDNEVDFKKSNKINYLLIAIGALIIVIAILVILLVKSNNKTNKETTTEDEEEKEESKDKEENIDEETIIENISKANDESFDDEEE